MATTKRRRIGPDIRAVESGKFRLDRILGRLHCGSTLITVRRAISPVIDDPSLKESLALQLLRHAARVWKAQRDLYIDVMGRAPYPSEADIGRAMLGDAAVRRELMR